MATKVTLEEMLAAGAHFGHQAKRWDPKMAPYIYGVRSGVHIFDLEKTREALLEAMEALTKALKEKKVVLLVGTKKQAKEKLTETAKKYNFPFVTERWLGGTLTNFDQVRRSVKKLQEMREKMKNNEYKDFTKRERILKQKEIEKLERKFGGLETLEKLPEVLFIIDTKRESGAVTEAQTLGIETIGVVDSNADPGAVTWPIPMNDDASQAIDFIISILSDTIEKAQSSKAKKNGKKA